MVALEPHQSRAQLEKGTALLTSTFQARIEALFTASGYDGDWLPSRRLLPPRSRSPREEGAKDGRRPARGPKRGVIPLTQEELAGLAGT